MFEAMPTVLPELRETRMDLILLQQEVNQSLFQQCFAIDPIRKPIEAVLYLPEISTQITPSKLRFNGLVLLNEWEFKTEEYLGLTDSIRELILKKLALKRWCFNENKITLLPYSDAYTICSSLTQLKKYITEFKSLEMQQPVSKIRREQRDSYLKLVTIATMFSESDTLIKEKLIQDFLVVLIEKEVCSNKLSSAVISLQSHWVMLLKLVWHFSHYDISSSRYNKTYSAWLRQFQASYSPDKTVNVTCFKEMYYSLCKERMHDTITTYILGRNENIHTTSFQWNIQDIAKENFSLN